MNSAKTTLIVTTDHGRGDWPVDWKSHGAKIKGSNSWWMAILGPDTPALGERKNLGPVSQNQVAATAAAALGFDYPFVNPRVGKALPGAIQPAAR